MKRQAFASPGFLLEREEPSNEVFIVLEARPPLLTIMSLISAG
jgi:hypothetical protein